MSVYLDHPLVQSSVWSQSTSVSLVGRTDISPQSKPVWNKEWDKRTSVDAHVEIIIRVQAQLKVLLENQIIYISECGTNAFEQEVDGLDGNHITLLRFISTGAQRQTQVQLHEHTHSFLVSHKQLHVILQFDAATCQGNPFAIYPSFDIIKKE